MDRFTFFAELPRVEPGSAVFTSAYLTQVPVKATDVLLEIGAASGDRATWIARSRGCRVVAVDSDPRFLPWARRRAEEGGASRLVLPVAADHGRLPFPDQTFRAVFAEGAALGLGLKQALAAWRRVVIPDGHLCLTYPGVVNKDAPAEVRGPLERRMAEPLGMLPDYHKIIRASGFELQHQVPLPVELWEAYYTDVVRHAWALMASGRANEQTRIVRDLLAEARWFRQIGRGRIFLQAMVLRRTR
ncbi:MAG: class I SAM-dependent methyltransferase [bacterium]